jgi:hypothetical protein
VRKVFIFLKKYKKEEFNQAWQALICLIEAILWFKTIAYFKVD